VDRELLITEFAPPSLGATYWWNKPVLTLAAALHLGREDEAFFPVVLVTQVISGVFGTRGEERYVGLFRPSEGRQLTAASEDVELAQPGTLRARALTVQCHWGCGPRRQPGTPPATAARAIWVDPHFTEEQFWNLAFPPAPAAGSEPVDAAIRIVSVSPPVEYRAAGEGGVT
jgi:hypothetical protein